MVLFVALFKDSPTLQNLELLAAARDEPLGMSQKSHFSLERTIAVSFSVFLS